MEVQCMMIPERMGKGKWKYTIVNFFCITGGVNEILTLSKL